jgi:succinate dehydrogenase/fumarate reductase cytochrome b subunit
MISFTDSHLRRVQAVSGLIFGAFLSLHLINTWLAAVSPEAYDTAQAVLRQGYQFPVVEPVILAALVVHVAAAVLRKRAHRPRPVSARARWHRNAGIFMAVFVFGHVLAVRGASAFAGVFPEFAGLSFTLTHVPGYFYPYYLLFGAAALYHGLNGAAIAAARLGWRFPLAGRALVSGTLLGTTLVLVALLGLGGVLYPIDDPYDNDYARLVMGLLGGSTP